MKENLCEANAMCCDDNCKRCAQLIYDRYRYLNDRYVAAERTKEDLISRNALYLKLQSHWVFPILVENYSEADKAMSSCLHAIANAPAVDNSRHGHWLVSQHETYIPVEFDENDEPIVHLYTTYKCSECGRVERKEEPYCNCGAKMNKGNE